MPIDTLKIVVDLLRETIAENGYEPTDLRPETRILEETAIDSLQLAAVVVKLEELTGKDPFKAGFIPFRTIRELADLYH